MNVHQQAFRFRSILETFDGENADDVINGIREMCPCLTTMINYLPNFYCFLLYITTRNYKCLIGKSRLYSEVFVLHQRRFVFEMMVKNGESKQHIVERMNDIVKEIASRCVLTCVTLLFNISHNALMLCNNSRCKSMFPFTQNPGYGMLCLRCKSDNVKIVKFM